MPPSFFELERLAHARVGTVLDQKWRLDRVLGVGGSGAVYAATHRNGKHAAVKVLHPAFAGDAGVRTRFAREGYAANRVQHPGVVSVIDDDTAPDGTAYLVMELIDGVPLQAVWERYADGMAADVVVAVGDALLDVLAAAHDKGVVHRDVKPDNVFVARDGSLKVLDFGIAQLDATKGTTKPGRVIGTPAFMSPEQARGDAAEVDERTDVWAVGATLFALLTGQIVHEASSMHERLVAARDHGARRLASVRGDLPPDLCEIVDRALAFQKADRWRGARAMQAALRTAATSLGWALGPAVVARLVIDLPPSAPLPETAPPPSARTTAAAPTPRTEPGSPLRTEPGGPPPEAFSPAPPFYGSPMPTAVTIREASATPPAVSIRPAPAPRKRRSRAPIAVAVVAALASLGAVAAWQLGSDAESPPPRAAASSAPAVVVSVVPPPSATVSAAPPLPTPRPAPTTPRPAPTAAPPPWPTATAWTPPPLPTTPPVPLPTAVPTATVAPVPTAAPPEFPAIDSPEARGARLAAASAASAGCRGLGVRGTAQVDVRYQADGRAVAHAAAPVAGSNAQSCVEQKFAGLRVQPQPGGYSARWVDVAL